jgi:hypothetical protein
VSSAARTTALQAFTLLLAHVFEAAREQLHGGEYQAVIDIAAAIVAREAARSAGWKS